MKNFIDCQWLKEHFADDNLIIIDCRFDLFDAEYGRAAYEKNHIKNAFYLDINQDLSGPKQEHGGARPLPDLTEFTIKLADMGINLDTTIICYDDITYSAARALWQFRYLGFAKVYILNGGLKEWQRLGLPTSQEIPQAKAKGHIQPQINQEIIRDIDDIKAAIEEPGIMLIDGREYRRFSGEYEPLYAKAGHIPGSACLYWQDNIAEDGSLKDIPTLKSNFAFVDDADEIIAYCGSAIDGALNYVILDELGYRISLYIGSFSDWISYDENAIETDN